VVIGVKPAVSCACKRAKEFCGSSCGCKDTCKNQPKEFLYPPRPWSYETTNEFSAEIGDLDDWGALGECLLSALDSLQQYFTTEMVDHIVEKSQAKGKGSFLKVVLVVANM